MNLADAVNRSGGGGNGYRGTGFSVLFAGERDVSAVDGVAANDVENLSVFFASGSESFLTLFDVVKEIFDL